MKFKCGEFEYDYDRKWIFELGDLMMRLPEIVGIDKMTDPERIVYCVYKLDERVCDGGFEGFF
jgi:hypothetical protein